MSDNDSFQAIFSGQKNRIFNFAYRMLQNKDSASDITQEVFLRLFKVQNSKPSLTNPIGWIFKTTRNLCLNQIRKDNREILTADISEIETSADDANSEQLECVRRAVAALEPPMREALILKVYERFSYEQIAEILGTTKPAVRSLLYKARVTLREKLNSKYQKR